MFLRQTSAGPDGLATPISPSATNPPSATTPRDSERWGARQWVSFLSMVMLLELLACSYVMISIAIPSISGHFGTTQGVWLVTAFLLVASVASPVIGKLADTHGKRRLLLSCVLLAVVGAVTAALAPTFPILLGGWALVGLLSPCLFLVYSLIRDVFPPRSVALAVSICTTGMGLVAVPAPILGGWLIDSFGFRSIFWFCAGFLLVMAALIRLTTDESPVRLRSRMDFLGSVLLGAGLAGVLVYVSMGFDWGWGSAFNLAFLIGGLVLLALWYVSARVLDDPVIDLGILLLRPVALTTLSSGLCWSVVAAFTVILPMVVLTPPDLALGYGFGLSHGQYGLMHAPIGGATLLGGFVVGYMMRRFSPRVLMIAGMVIAGMACLGVAAALTHLALMTVFAALVGLGCGMGYAATPNLLIASVPPEHQATAGAIASTSGNVFPAILPVVVFAVLNAHVADISEGTPLYSGAGVELAFSLIGIVSLVGAAIAIALPRGLRGPVPSGTPHPTF